MKALPRGRGTLESPQPASASPPRPSGPQFPLCRIGGDANPYLACFPGLFQG